MFPKVVYLGQICSLPTFNNFTTGIGSSTCLQMTARFTGLFMMKMMRNNSTHYSNRVKIGNFVFILKKVKFYVLPIQEILLAILTLFVIYFNLSMIMKQLISGYHWFLVYSGIPKHVSPGNKEVFSNLYKALAIPILQNGVPLWWQYLQKNIDGLEWIQHRASKYALPMWSRDSPYEERLAMLGWSSLQSRRS